MGSRHETPERPRTWYPPITHSIPSAYFGRDAFKPTLEPAFVARSARNVGPVGESIDGAPRVRVVDDPAPSKTSKHVEFIRSLRCLPREREEDAAARRAETATRGPYGFPVGDATTLWNRDPTGAPVHVSARQHIPMLTLTPDVTALLGRIAAEVTTEANEARRLRALEEDDDHPARRRRRLLRRLLHIDNALLQEGAPRRRPLHPRRQVRRLHHHAPSIHHAHHPGLGTGSKGVITRPSACIRVGVGGVD